MIDFSEEDAEAVRPGVVFIDWTKRNGIVTDFASAAIARGLLCQHRSLGRLCQNDASGIATQ